MIVTTVGAATAFVKTENPPSREPAGTVTVPGTEATAGFPSVVLGSVMIVAAARWQRQLADLMGADAPSTVGYFRAGVLAVLIGALLLTIARVLRDLARLIARGLRTGRVPRAIANVLAVAVVAFLIVGTAQVVLVQAGTSLLNMEWSTRNDATREGTVTRGNDRLATILGTPLAGETVDGRVLDGNTEVGIFPGDLPDDPESVFARNGAGPELPLRFVRFRPPRLERSAEGLTLSLPHIRLDRALEFLLGDRLA